MSQSSTTKRATIYPGSHIIRLLMVFLVAVATVCGRPCNEGSAFDLCIFASAISEDMYTDYMQLFGQYRPEARERQQHEIMRRSEIIMDTEDPKNSTDDADVVDREDHVTQYLSELLVNTDSEITSLQASDVEDSDYSGALSKEDVYFSYLTGQEAVLEIDSAWSFPAQTIIEESEMHNNVKK